MTPQEKTPEEKRRDAGFSKAMWYRMPRTNAFGQQRKGATKGKAWTPSQKGRKG